MEENTGEKLQKPVKGWRMFWTLFSSTFAISALTVGGGGVIVPLIQRKFVEGLKWIDENEMMDMVAIAQSAPGAMAVNTSIIVGYRVAGVLGSLVTVLGTVLPPLIIISIVAVIYEQFSTNRYVAMALAGMQAGVVAVMLNVTWKMGKNVIKQKKALANVLMALSAVAAIIFKINIIYIILACGLVGGLATVISSRREKKGGRE